MNIKNVGVVFFHIKIRDIVVKKVHEYSKKKYNTMDFSQQLPIVDYYRTYQYITNSCP